MMMRNYRSTPQIIAAANSLIDNNRHRVKKELIPTLPDGLPVTFDFAANADEEAAHICARIRSLAENGAQLRDIAVLYRAHYVSRAIEEQLLKQKLPYRIYGGVPFFGRAEIKDALSYLRMAVMQDDLSFRRVVNNPKRNIGSRRIEFLEAYAAEHGLTLYESLKRTLDDDMFKGTRARQFVGLIEAHSADWEHRRTSDMLSAMLNESGYETMLRTEGAQARLDNLAELTQSVLDFENTCGEEATPFYYLAHVAMFTDSDADSAGDKVRLMSVHAAKGLEFPYVFLCGMNEGIFPSGKVRDLAGMEEERRLAFVAMTRAQKGLFLSGAQGRNLDGSPRYPSRFVLDIDQELIDFIQPPDEGLIADAREYIGHSEKYLPEELASVMLPPGTRVMHEFLGEGEILESDAEKGAYLIRFDSLPTPRRISLKVKLTPVNE